MARKPVEGNASPSRSGKPETSAKPFVRFTPLEGVLRERAYPAERELRLKGPQVSACGLRGMWLCHNLATKHERLLRMERATAERSIELKEEQVKLLERISPEFRERHIEAQHRRSLVAVETFFVTSHGPLNSPGAHRDGFRLPRNGPSNGTP